MWNYIAMCISIHNPQFIIESHLDFDGSICDSTKYESRKMAKSIGNCQAEKTSLYRVSPQNIFIIKMKKLINNVMKSRILKIVFMVSGFILLYIHYIFYHEYI